MYEKKDPVLGLDLYWTGDREILSSLPEGVALCGLIQSHRTGHLLWEKPEWRYGSEHFNIRTSL